jgi:hypothetical protein
MKIHPVEAELFHVDGQTDRQTDIMKLIVPFHSFANTPKNHENSNELGLIRHVHDTKIQNLNS